MQERDSKYCYLRVSTKETFCSLPLKVELTKDNKWQYVDGYRQGQAEFEGHYLVWMDFISPTTKVRDMECYCDHHPEVCPFDDYTPNPDNPKPAFEERKTK